MPTVFVSGVFDLLHSGHITFLESAALFGDLLVAIGSDQTVLGLKGRLPICPEPERLYQVRALRCVKEAFISAGQGILDFERELRASKPDIFVVNEDGAHVRKELLCRELGVDYRALRRDVSAALPQRSTSRLRNTVGMPLRIELAGGWLDQPAVSALCPGSVIVASIGLEQPMHDRAGLAGSTQRTAIQIWGNRLPDLDPSKAARILFGAENPPGSTPISGSQDALGIALPGLSRLDYEGDYWPVRIESVGDEVTMQWVESHVAVVPLGARPSSLRVADGACISLTSAKRLAEGSALCQVAIEQRDVELLGRSFSTMLAAQVEMFPAILPTALRPRVEQLSAQGYGVKFTGAGGGGCLLIAVDHPGAESVPYHIRRHAPPIEPL